MALCLNITGRRHVQACAAAAFVLAVGFMVSATTGMIVCLAYLLLRGVADPIRRSARWNWWADYPASFVLAPLCALVIDTAKLMGRIQGTLEQGRV